MAEPALAIRDLDVFHGASHALQGVSLTLRDGVLGVVGRNGMGKTTLCNTVTGLIPARAGSVRVRGTEVLGLPANTISHLGVGYVPQGRRVWPSLTVDEHLRLAARDAKGVWTVARIYETFPRLAERRRNGGSQLSGGEQQMLAIGRALLLNPTLLVMDEPTEGLAPVIVEQVAAMLKRLAAERTIAVLLIEQNLGVALEVADRIAILVNGRVMREMDAAALAADPDLQQRLLGVGRHAHDEEPEAPQSAPADQPDRVFAVRRAEDADDDIAPPPPNRWGAAPAITPATAAGRAEEALPPMPAPGPMVDRVCYVAGTFDTKARELGFIRRRLEALGMRVCTVDLGTTRRPSAADVGPLEVARAHPRGAEAVFSDDRGASVTAMAEAFARWLAGRRDVGGIISAGGSGGTALATPAMRMLPVGIPKIMISTVASGDVRRYVGSADICMMHSVTDVQGLNRISEQVLGNAAHALAGMVAHAVRDPRRGATRPAIGLTMFGVTTPCVQMVQAALEDRYDCLVFHATGTGGQSFEKLAESGLLEGVIDVTTTEIADELVGGVLSAGPDRLDAFSRRPIPYVGSVGACDMVNFSAMETVPAKFRGRNFVVHNANVTLMRTTPEECAAVGRFIGEKLSRMAGPVRFLLPEGGVSLLDAPGKPFHDPAADKALFDAIVATFRASATRQLRRVPHALNDPAFAHALVRAFQEVVQPQTGMSRMTA